MSDKQVLGGGGWERPGNCDALASENYYIPAGRHPGQLYCCDVITITVCYKIKCRELVLQNSIFNFYIIIYCNIIVQCIRYYIHIKMYNHTPLCYIITN